MKTVVRYHKKNRSQRIIRGGVISGRQINLGPDNATKQARKTKKGAADLLEKDDKSIERTGTGIFNPQQREALIQRAGKAYGAAARKSADPWRRIKGEPIEEYVARINALVAAQSEE